MIRPFVGTWVLVSFLFTSIFPPFVFAHAPLSVLNLPAPGTMLQLSKAYTPTLLNGITVHPEDPFRFDFLVSPGDSPLKGKQLEQESARLVKYFMACLTVPDKDLWVNLSPYEKNRIIPDEFGVTMMGRDLLAQDYILKELSSSLTYPEGALGKEFWKEVYQKAYERYGTTQIPLNTFNKIWIIADSAKIYEHDHSAYVVESKLKVMLEEDLLALHKNVGRIMASEGMTQGQAEKTSRISCEVLREIIIPAIEKEVNEGQDFASLRQVYQSLILATWFKMKLKNSLLGRIYVDRKKVGGINDNDQRVNQQIYETYLKACRKGVFNFIKEESDQLSLKPTPRKYFSGGFNLTQAFDGKGQMVPLSQKIDIIREDSPDFAQVAEALQPRLRRGILTLSASLAPSRRAGDRRAHFISQPYPDPVTHRGEDYPEWDDALLLGKFILHQSPSLTFNEILERAPEFFRRRGVNNMDRVRLLQLMEGLREQGIIENDSEQVFGDNKIHLAVPHRQLALWSRDTDFIKNDLERALLEEQNWASESYADHPEQRPLMKVLEDYDKYVAIDWQRPTEAKHPVLNAITLMPPERQDEILNILLNPKLHLKPLPDDIALAFAADRLGAQWLAKQFPELVGRTVIVVTPELSTFAGGLGRVIKFFTASMAKRGVKVIVIEGWYKSKVKFDDSGRPEKLVPLDYNTVPVPIPGLDQKPVNHSEVIYDGRYRKVESREGENTDQVHIVQLGDGGWSDTQWGEETEYGQITAGLYAYDKPSIGAPKSFNDFALFFSKAAVDFIINQEIEKLRTLRAEQRESEYKAPVLLLQDGQALLTAFFLKLFYIDKDPVAPRHLTDPLKQAAWVRDAKIIASLLHDALADTHTYFNTGSNGDLNGMRERLLREGVPEKYLHYFLRKSPWGNIAVDMSSPGLRTGIATGVAAIHAFYRQNDVLQPVVGVSNGDELPYSGEFFDKIMKRLFAEYNAQKYWDVTTDMLSQEKHAAIADLSNELGVDLDPNMPLFGMIQRSSEEKGWRQVFTLDNVLEVIKRGNLLAFANVQPYEESRDIISYLEHIRDEVRRLKTLHPEIYKGEFVVKGYDPNLQRLALAALTAQIHSPWRVTGANEKTETNELRNGGLIITTAYQEGMIQAGITFRLPQKSLLEKLSKDEYTLGTTLVINGTNSGDWKYAMLRMQEIYYADQEAFRQAQIMALKVSRSLSYDATTGDYLQLIQQSFKRPAKRLVARDINGEVSMEPNQTKLLVDGHEVPHIGPKWQLDIDDRNARSVKLQITVNLRATDVFDGGKQGYISEDLVKAVLISEWGVEIPLTYKNRPNGIMLMEATLPPGLPLPFKGRIEVNSGLWLSSVPIEIDFTDGKTTKLGDWLVNQLRGHQDLEVQTHPDLPDNIYFPSLEDMYRALLRLKNSQGRFQDIAFSQSTDGSGRITKINIHRIYADHPEHAEQAPLITALTNRLVNGHPDAAQKANGPGGILLDSAYLKMQIQGASSDKAQQALLMNFDLNKFQGFRLVVLSLTPTPAGKLQCLLGLE